MGSRSQPGTLKYCTCVKCQGAWISRYSFYKHKEKLTESLLSSPTPSFEYPESSFNAPEFTQPLFEGSSTSVLEAVTKHLYVFSVNHGMSKTALSDSLMCEKSSLPQPNHLPSSYKEARTLVAPLLMPLQKYDVCINDCVIFRDSGEYEYANLNECPQCLEPRKENGKSRKMFTYMPIGPRLSRWFGTENLCKLIYEKTLTVSRSENNEVIRDFTDSEQSIRGLKQDRQLLGPMMLMGIIPSGKNGSEPKSLEPYLSVVVDELLSLTEFTVLNSYTSAPTTVKVALLRYLCDIPGYSKLFHLSGHGGLRSCPYCQEHGHYCKHLRKTIHISNRTFLPSNHPLRNSEGFAVQGPDRNSRPKAYSLHEETALRDMYQQKPNKNQKQKQQKRTGLKGNYILQKLPYHNRLEQMSPDGMHTLADFISHLMEMLSGKYNGEKVLSCEKNFNRFPDIHSEISDDEKEQPKKKRKLDPNSKPDVTPPWSLSKEQIKIADERAQHVLYTNAEDISPGPHFSKLWTLRTMNSKIQFVTSGALEWCIQGLLPPTQEKTLKCVCDVLKRMVSPVIHMSTLDELQKETHEAFALLERDFPLTMQNLTTHLIHHVVEDLARFGPMYGRWLFPYERANGWITRQCLRKGMEESTVMETYAIYDWCVHMILSGKFNPVDALGKTSLMKTSERLMEKLDEDSSAVTGRKQHRKKNVLLTDSMKIHMRGNKPPSIVKLPCVNNNQFAQVCFFLEHSVNSSIHHWAIVELFPLAEKCNSFFCMEDKPLQRKLFHSSLLGKPLVNVKNQGKVWILRD
uniref:DUF4218 domain-containing protein n=1 Tax=Magallana gigas TaxID=29159 RepID=A0A8W8MQL9_MAGGI